MDVTADVAHGYLLPKGRRVAHAVIHLLPEASRAPMEVFDVPELQDFADLYLRTPVETLVEYQEGAWDNNLIIVSSLNIEPSFRGRNLSYTVMDSIRSVMGRAGSLVAINAAPVVRGTGPDADAAYARGRAALRAHWERYGFGHVGGGLMLTRNFTDTDEKHPSLHVW
ncbi:hypothetical protein [Arthrobacter sp. zg-Y1110]|uniref:hypothetical protein n=1 Tax=Arthrobacter sp. zg-Y1110 TaxID=2886932 RepID=UPI001D14D57F|nr:hypothetical protein [Arthrobacter sp. zg-Y1110]MCC3292419.1 hypothetical protein [Arthrobacter sp. zg-Y1110]UWX87145.1 hypothetical protein N2K99_17700 [Arthrobacter sp. zg-Y1110]